MTILKLDSIRLDGGTQVRSSLDTNKLADYAEAMVAGDVFPLMVVFHDGSSYWLSCGFHRYHTFARIGRTEVEVDLKKGTVEDAQLYAFGANARNGIPLSPEDTRRTVIRMLEHSLTKNWSSADIARHVKTSAMTVGRIRAEFEKQNPSEDKVREYKRNGKTFKINTEGMGRKAKEKPPEAPQDNELMSELTDTIGSLEEENKRLKDRIAVGQWDASDIEKIDAQETIDELRGQIRVLEIENQSLRESRDMFQARNAELMSTVKSLQAKLKKLDK